MKSLLCLLAAATVVFPLHAAAAAPDHTAGPSARAEVVSDTSALRERAGAIISRFVAQAREASAVDLGEAPTLALRIDPYIIYYTGLPANQIVVPWWSDLPPEARAFVVDVAGGEAEGERVFDLFFNRFLIAHEAAHWLQGRVHPGYTREERYRYAQEDHANRLAVAFWRTQPGGEAFLRDLEAITTPIVGRLADPTPPGEEPAQYFNAHYYELAMDGYAYGYYQFRFVLEALRDRERLDVNTLVGDLVEEGRAWSELPTIAQVVREALQTGGVEAARARHRELSAARPDSLLFRESDLNALGYALLEQGQVAEAVAVFEMNAGAYPNAPNVHDSLGDGLRAAGRREDARQAYTRAVALAEQQEDTRLPNFRANLERASRGQ